MNPKIGLRIDAKLGAESLPNGALVNVRSLGLDGKSQLLHSVSVPITGNAKEQRTVTVPPGLYEVSAFLPSGSMLNRIVDVSSEDMIYDGTLETPTASRDWFAWTEQADFAPAAAAGPISHSDAAPPPVPEVPSIRMFRVPPGAPHAPEPVWAALAAQLANLGPSVSIDPAVVIPANAEDLPVNVREIEQRQVVHPAASPDGQRTSRAYLVVQRGKEAMLSVMPWPWGHSDGNGLAMVHAEIGAEGNRSEGEAMPWFVRPAVRDRILAGLLEYSAAGEQRTARALIEPARELLFHKSENPLAAAAGAYLLVGQWIDESTRGNTLDWMGWVRNLSQRFEWLPDGALLWGWLALRLRGRDPQVDEARHALLEAERRGIPYYVPGVRRLVDGLMLLSGEARRRNQPDAEIDAALVRARRLAWQIDPNQPFTSIRLWSS